VISGIGSSIGRLAYRSSIVLSLAERVVRPGWISRISFAKNESKSAHLTSWCENKKDARTPVD